MVSYSYLYIIKSYVTVTFTKAVIKVFVLVNVYNKLFIHRLGRNHSTVYILTVIAFKHSNNYNDEKNCNLKIKSK